MDQNPEVTYSTVVQTPAKKPYPGFLQAVLLLVILNVIVFIVMLFCVFAGAIARVPLHEDPVMRVIAYTCASILILWLGIEISSRPLHELFPFREIHSNLLLPVVVSVIGLQLISAPIGILLVDLVPSGDHALMPLLGFISGYPHLAVVLIVLIGPITEELFFRGVVLRGFLKRYTITKAILLSALLFTVSHNIFQFISAFLIGILLAWWFVKTRSLVPCIFGHVFNNALVLCVAFLPLGQPRADIGVREMDILWILIPGFVFLGLGIWLSKRMFTMEVKAN